MANEEIKEPKTTRPEDVYYMHTTPSPPLRALIVIMLHNLKLLSLMADARTVTDKIETD